MIHILSKLENIENALANKMYRGVQKHRPFSDEEVKEIGEKIFTQIWDFFLKKWPEEEDIINKYFQNEFNTMLPVNYQEFLRNSFEVNFRNIARDFDRFMTTYGDSSLPAFLHKLNEDYEDDETEPTTPALPSKIDEPVLDLTDNMIKFFKNHKSAPCTFLKNGRLIANNEEDKKNLKRLGFYCVKHGDEFKAENGYGQPNRDLFQEYVVQLGFDNDVTRRSNLQEIKNKAETKLRTKGLENRIGTLTMEELIEVYRTWK